MERPPQFTEDEIQTEIDSMGLMRAHSVRLHKVSHQLKRFLIRSSRILIGIAFAAIAYSVASNSMEVLGRPISSVSVVQIFSGICGLGLALCISIAALGVAFGPSPTPEDYEQAARFKAYTSLATKHPVGLSIKTVDFSVNHMGYQVEK